MITAPPFHRFLIFLADAQGEIYLGPVARNTLAREYGLDDAAIRAAVDFLRIVGLVRVGGASSALHVQMRGGRQ